MNVASLELCKELRELSGWYDTDFHYRPVKNSEGNIEYLPYYRMGNYASSLGDVYPAYDLGYLLRKLSYPSSGDTPEDALCKLAIELAKQGLLEKDATK